MNTDTATLNLLRDFLDSPKPPNTECIDVLQTLYFLAHKAAEHPFNPSQGTMAAKFGCERRTILRSQRKLRRLGWLGLSSDPQRGKSNPLSVDVSKIPLEKPSAVQVTEAAKQLAFRYK